MECLTVASVPGMYGTTQLCLNFMQYEESGVNSPSSVFH